MKITKPSKSFKTSLTPGSSKSLKDKIYKVICAGSVSALKKKTEKENGNLEIRADYMPAADIPLILATKFKNKTIFTCRSKAEGGVFKGNEKERVAILKSAPAAGFNYVDIELETIKKHKMSFNKKEREKLIISFHNFKHSYSMAGLVKIKREMQKYKPAVIKIAVMPETQKEIFVLTGFLMDTIEEGQKIILIAMGSRAAFTRVLFPELGSFATYACAGKAVAPGQLSIKDFNKIMEII